MFFVFLSESTNFLLRFVLHFQMGDKNVFIKYLWLQAMTYFRNSSCKLRKLEKYLVKWSVSKQFPELWHLNVVCKDISFVAEKNYTLSFNEFFSQLNLRFLYMSTFPFPAITNLLFLQYKLTCLIRSNCDFKMIFATLLLGSSVPKKSFTASITEEPKNSSNRELVWAMNTFRVL